MYVLANLTSEQLHTIQQFEQSANARVLALSTMDVDPASIDGELLQKLQQIEEELGLCLVAVR